MVFENTSVLVPVITMGNHVLLADLGVAPLLVISYCIIHGWSDVILVLHQ
jgi:hypothetical protein